MLPFLPKKSGFFWKKGQTHPLFWQLWILSQILSFTCSGSELFEFRHKFALHIGPKRKIQRLLNVIFLNRNFFRPIDTLSQLDSDTMGVNRAARIKIFTYPCPPSSSGVPEVITESPRSKFCAYVMCWNFKVGLYLLTSGAKRGMWFDRILPWVVTLAYHLTKATVPELCS